MPPDWYVIPVLSAAAAFCLLTVGWHLRDWWHEHFPERAPDAALDEPGDTQAVDEDAVHARWARLRESYQGEKS